jgi:hypothetical protein
VRCFDENNTAIYTNVFSFVPTKTNVEERCAERVKKYSKNFCPRKFFDEFSGCHGNYVNKSIICYFIIANKLKGRHINV